MKAAVCLGLLTSLFLFGHVSQLVVFAQMAVCGNQARMASQISYCLLLVCAEKQFAKYMVAHTCYHYFFLNLSFPIHCNLELSSESCCELDPFCQWFSFIDNTT